MGNLLPVRVSTASKEPLDYLDTHHEGVLTLDSTLEIVTIEGVYDGGGLWIV